jgi:hypothetical protein
MSDATVFALIAMIGAAISLILQTMGKRDQLKYDVKLAIIEDRQKRCEEDGATKNIRIATLEAHIITLTAADVKDRVELDAKITQLESHSSATSLTPRRVP